MDAQNVVKFILIVFAVKIQKLGQYMDISKKLN